MIGSLHAYLSRYRHVIMWVSNYRYPIWTSCNWIPTWFLRQSCTLKSLQVHISKLMKSNADIIAQKKFSKIFLISKFVKDKNLIFISNWTSCFTIQGIIMLIILNLPWASCWSEFGITHMQLLPELYSTWSNYYYRKLYSAAGWFRSICMHDIKYSDYHKYYRY